MGKRLMYAPSTPPPGLSPGPTSDSSKMTVRFSAAFPLKTRRGAGPPPSTTISDALAVTSANSATAVQPRCSHSLTAPTSPLV